MASAKFHHFGVPTAAKAENEIFIEGAGVHVTDPESHTYGIEFLRFEPDSQMPDILKTKCHAAFMVENLQDALKDQNVLIEPFDATDTIRVAFITDGDALIELMETK